jgi:hypothetical protein
MNCYNKNELLHKDLIAGDKENSVFYHVHAHSKNERFRFEVRSSAFTTPQSIEIRIPDYLSLEELYKNSVTSPHDKRFKSFNPEGHTLGKIRPELTFKLKGDQVTYHIKGLESLADMTPERFKEFLKVEEEIDPVTFNKIYEDIKERGSQKP